MEPSSCEKSDSSEQEDVYIHNQRECVFCSDILQKMDILFEKIHSIKPENNYLSEISVLHQELLEKNQNLEQCKDKEKGISSSLTMNKERIENFIRLVKLNKSLKKKVEILQEEIFIKEELLSKRESYIKEKELLIIEMLEKRYLQ